MKNLAFTLLACGILMSCASDNEKNDIVPVDEMHRPADYSNRIEMTIQKDLTADGIEYHPVRFYNGEKDFESLLEQLWKLAFSGDSKVHGINFLGEFDEENVMDPKQLVDALEQFDTVMIDDLMTGELKDSVLDMSFTKSQVSALSIYFICDDLLTPYAVGFGQKVYDSEGVYRGVSNKFFIKLDESVEGECKQRLAIQSDSTGLMKPVFFDFYFENNETPFQNALGESADSVIQLSMEILLDSKGNRMQLLRSKSADKGS